MDSENFILQNYSVFSLFQKKQEEITLQELRKKYITGSQNYSGGAFSNFLALAKMFSVLTEIKAGRQKLFKISAELFGQMERLKEKGYV